MRIDKKKSLPRKARFEILILEQVYPFELPVFSLQGSLVCEQDCRAFGLL